MGVMPTCLPFCFPTSLPPPAAYSTHPQTIALLPSLPEDFARVLCCPWVPALWFPMTICQIYPRPRALLYKPSGIT